MAIVPIPAGRTTDSLIRFRLLAQLSQDQTGLLNLQTQISSGQRLNLPSDDAPSALRAVSLQQLLDRKAQLQTNLTTNQSFLSASDSALSQISGLLASVRGVAQSAIGVLATNDQRSAAASQVHQALSQVLNAANQQFRGRYLFGGSRTQSPPFSNAGEGVRYDGNQNALLSFADVGLLFPTNSDGDAVFGALSASVEGTVDLDPALSDDTRLADLHGGRGIPKGSISISDGTSTSVVNLSNAETLGDVIDLIQHSPPNGRTVTVLLTAAGLNVALDASGGGNLTIKEFAGGATASELGILKQVGQGTGPIVGQDLDPRITETTRLADLLGVRASATITSSGGVNDFVIEARTNGAQYNGVTVSFVNNPGLSSGQETVTYNASQQTLIFQIADGQTTAQNVIDALNTDPQVGALFEAHLSAHDIGLSSNPNSTFIEAAATATISGGSGINFDQHSGLTLTSGSQHYTIDFSQAKTVQDLLNTLNASPAGVLAQINSQGTGINVGSRQSGTDFTIGENGGATATQLGVRSFTAETRLESLNHGVGVHTLNGQAPDFIIHRKDGIDLKIDVSQAETIGDVMDLINNHPANLDLNHSVNARLSTVGNGIELYATDTSTIAPLSVTRNNGSQAAVDLGLVPEGAPSSDPAVASGGIESITGRDVNPGEVNGVFTALVRLEQALRTNDDVGIERGMQLLDDNATRVNLARAEIGARQQGLDVLNSGLSTEVTTLKESLSTEIDTDLPTALSNLAGRQAAFQAALQTAAAMSKLSLLDFL